MKITDPRNKCDRCGVIAEGTLRAAVAEQAQLLHAALTARRMTPETRAAYPAMCKLCKDGGVIETGNNDFPCSCPAGDGAVFNTVLLRVRCTARTLATREPRARRRPAAPRCRAHALERRARPTHLQHDVLVEEHEAMNTGKPLQSNAMAVIAVPWKRFEELTAALAAIGATVRYVAMTHDDAHFEITCPQGREAEAATILERIFPS